MYVLRGWSAKSTSGPEGGGQTMRHAAVIAATIILAAGTASAKDYPSRTIPMVGPSAAGGPTDTVARLLAEPMTVVLGQQVIVENVGGAGGTLGAGRVAKAD